MPLWNQDSFAPPSRDAVNNLRFISGTLMRNHAHLHLHHTYIKVYPSMRLNHFTQVDIDNQCRSKRGRIYFRDALGAGRKSRIRLIWVPSCHISQHSLSLSFMIKMIKLSCGQSSLSCDACRDKVLSFDLIWVCVSSCQLLSTALCLCTLFLLWRPILLSLFSIFVCAFYLFINFCFVFGIHLFSSILPACVLCWFRCERSALPKHARRRQSQSQS